MQFQGKDNYSTIGWVFAVAQDIWAQGYEGSRSGHIRWQYTCENSLVAHGRPGAHLATRKAHFLSDSKLQSTGDREDLLPSEASVWVLSTHL